MEASPEPADARAPDERARALERIASAARTPASREASTTEDATADQVIDAGVLAMIGAKALARGAVWAVVATTIVQATCILTRSLVIEPLTLSTDVSLAGAFPELWPPALVFFAAAPCALVELVAARGHRSLGRDLSASGLVACVAIAWFASALRLSNVALFPGVDVVHGASLIFGFVRGEDLTPAAAQALGAFLLGWLVSAPLFWTCLSRLVPGAPHVMHRVWYGAFLASIPALFVLVRTRLQIWPTAVRYLALSIAAGMLAPLLAEAIDRLAPRVRPSPRLALALVLACLATGAIGFEGRRALLEQWLLSELGPENVTLPAITSGLKLASILPPAASDRSTVRSLIESQQARLDSSRLSARVAALVDRASVSRPADAIPLLDEALELDPSCGLACTLRGRARIALARGTSSNTFAQARALATGDLKRALVCSPRPDPSSGALALWTLAQLADDRAGRRTDLGPLLERCAAIEPAGVWTTLARARLKSLHGDGDFGNGRKLVEKFRDADVATPEAAAGLAAYLRWDLACGCFSLSSRHTGIKVRSGLPRCWLAEVHALVAGEIVAGGLDLLAARTEVDAALGDDPTWAPAHGILALLELRAGDPEWERDAARALEIDPEESWSLYARAEATAFEAPERTSVVADPKARATARALLVQVLDARDEVHALADLALARLDLFEGDLDSALGRSHRLSLLSADTNAAALALRRVARQAKGFPDPVPSSSPPPVTSLQLVLEADMPRARRAEPARMIGVVEALLKKSPDDPLLHYARAVFLYETERFADARGELEQVIDVRSPYVSLGRAFLYRGLSRIHQGDVKGASEDKESARTSGDRLNRIDREHFDQLLKQLETSLDQGHAEKER